MPALQRPRCRRRGARRRVSAASAPAWTEPAVPLLMILRHGRQLGATPAGWLSQPTRQPVIAQALEKLLTASTRSSSLGDLQDRGRHRVPFEIEPVVDLVGDDPDAGAAAEFQQRPHVLARWRSSRSGWTGVEKDDGAGARIAGGEQPVEVEPPVGVEGERHGPRLGADQVDRVADVGPLRLDIDDVGADDRRRAPCARTAPACRPASPSSARPAIGRPWMRVW